MDDWVFICFFVGNDFLPHMPSLEIREGAIDRLVSIWKKNLPMLEGYLTSDGTVNCHRVQVLFKDLGEQEDEIFRMRKEDEDRQKERNKRRKHDARQKRDNLMRAMESAAVTAVQASHRSAADPSRGGSAYERARGSQHSNKAAAAALRASLMGGGHAGRDGGASESQGSTGAATPSKGEKRKAEDDDEETQIPDDVRLHEDGWKERYYQTKFGVSASDKPFVDKVCRSCSGEKGEVEYVATICGCGAGGAGVHGGAVLGAGLLFPGLPVMDVVLPVPLLAVRVRHCRGRTYGVR